MNLIDELAGALDTEADVRAEITDVLVAHFLRTKLGELISLQNQVDPESVSEVLAVEITSRKDQIEFRDTIESVLNDATGNIDPDKIKLSELIPDRIIEFVHDQLGRDYQPDRRVVRDVIKHSIMRRVVRDVLEDTLREFVERMTEWIRESGTVPGMSGAWSLFSNFFGMARQYTKRYSDELEKRVESQIDTFVDEMIDEVLNRMVQQISSSEMTEDLAKWRQQVFDRLIDQPISNYLRGLKNIDPDRLEEEAALLIEVLPEKEKMREIIVPLVRFGIEIIEGLTLEEFFEVIDQDDRARQKIAALIENRSGG